VIDRSDRAVELFRAGANCSQAVFVAYAAEFGMDEETAMRVSAGHGGGVGRLREVCGAVSGMALLAGMKHGATRPEDAAAKRKTYEGVQELAEVFRAEHGAIVCRTLLGLDADDAVSAAPEARTAGYYARRPCVELVRHAARIVAERL